LADGVSQSMAAFTPRRPSTNTTSANTTQNGSLPPYMSGQGPIMKVRERSVRSIPMSRPSRSSLSASTPDSLSDNEGSHVGPADRYTPRKVTYTSTRSGLTPVGSKPNSRPLSRQGSKPSSRQGSTLSLDSTDETGTPSRIPQRKPSAGTFTVGGSLTRPSRLSVGGATSTPRSTGTTTRKTTSGSASPARRNVSGSVTPSGLQTPRKTSADPTFSSTMRRTSRGTTPVDKREPFRL
jgi:dystonin